jgi:hypothetical protein
MIDKHTETPNSLQAWSGVKTLLFRNLTVASILFDFISVPSWTLLLHHFSQKN